MADILNELLQIVVEVKLADSEIEATPVGETVEIDIPDFDIPIRLRGGKHVKVSSVVVTRTK